MTACRRDTGSAAAAGLSVVSGILAGMAVVRVLVTGSRWWKDAAVIRAELARVWHPERVLLTGKCPTGADALAEACWLRWGGHVELGWKADWARYGRAAGPIRNRAMVESQPDCCLGFLLPGSRGAAQTVRWAREAGIPTRVVRG